VILIRCKLFSRRLDGQYGFRLTAGIVAKAERSELALWLPIGPMRDPSGVVVKDPDMAVQEIVSSTCS
jgi:hypothetical protein